MSPAHAPGEQQIRQLHPFAHRLRGSCCRKPLNRRSISSCVLNTFIDTRTAPFSVPGQVRCEDEHALIALQSGGEIARGAVGELVRSIFHPTIPVAPES